MKHFAENVINQAGVPVAGATITVFVTGTQTKASIFSDDGITAKGNPLTSDSLGRFDFYVADGRYDLAVTGTAILPFTISNVEIADVTESQAGDATWATRTVNVTNQTILPGTPAAGSINLYSKNLDKRLYYKDDTGTEIGPLVPGGIVSPVSAPSPFVYNTDMEFKGPNPWVDIRNFGARAANPNITPSNIGLTANCVNTSANVSISSASTFVNGDGVVLYGCGQAHTMLAPVIASVTPSVALAGTATLHSTAGAGGATTYNYKMIARDRSGGLTAASAVVSTTTGAALGAQIVNITSMTRSSRTVTVTTTAAHGFLVGCGNNACGEVFIGGGNALNDATFRGWFTVTSAVDSTHFTFSSGPDTTLGATTSATGGTATFYNSNTVCVSAPGSGATPVQYYLASDRNSPGTFSIIAAGYPNSGGGNTIDLCIDDYGSPMMDNQAFPPFITAAAPWVSATSDHLSTTIANGAGSTTLTLANAAGTTLTGATIRLDAVPGILAAYTAAQATGAAVLIPKDPGGNQFVINSWLNTGTAGIASFAQTGNLYLNDTFEIPSNGGGGNKYIGDILPNVGSGVPSGAWGIYPAVGVNTAHPGFWFSISQQFGLMVRGLSIGSVPLNGSVLMIAEGGFNQSFDHINFVSGSGVQDYISIGLMMKGSPGQGSSNVLLDFVTFSPGGVGDAVSHTPTFWCRQCGAVAIPRSYSVHRGMLFEASSVSLADGGVAYINGGGTPLATVYPTGATASIQIGNVATLDTFAHPCIAILNNANGATTPVNFVRPIAAGGGCLPSSGVLGVTGNYNLLFGFGNPTFYNSLASTGGVDNFGTPFASQLFNSYVSVGPNRAVFIRSTPPATPTCTVSAGGSVPIGTYQFSVIPVWQSGGEGVSSPSSAACTTTSGNQTITINYSGVPGNPKGLDLYYCISNGSICTGAPAAANTFSNPQPPNSTSFVWTSLAFNSAVASTAPTAGPTMLLPGIQGIAAPVGIFPTIGASSTQQHTIPVTASDTLALVNATQTLANKTLAVGSISPGANGQCVNTSGSASVWGSCAGTAGVQLIGLPNTTASQVNAAVSTVQPFAAACASPPCYAANAITGIGKTFEIEGSGSMAPLNTTEFVTLGFQVGSNAATSNAFSFFVPTSTQTWNWYLKAVCTLLSSGSTPNALCMYMANWFLGTNPPQSFAEAGAVNIVAANMGVAWSPQITIQFNSASATNTATQSIALTRQDN